MAALAIDYLIQTTAHGFNRLLHGPAEGNGGRFRKLWAVVIAAAFSTAGYLIVSSVQEVNRSPIATDIEYVPVQNFPFPSVTLAARNSYERYVKATLRNTILEQLTYDCFHHKELTDEAILCHERSTKVRSIVQPLTRPIFETIFDRYMEVVLADEAKLADHYTHLVVCYFYASSQIEEWELFVNPLMESLSIPGDQARYKKVRKYLDLIADLFKAPLPIIVTNMTDLVQEFPRATVTESECSDNFVVMHVSQEAKAMALLVAKVLYDDSRISIGTWHRMVQYGRFSFNTSARDDFAERYQELEGQVDQGIENLLRGADAALSDAETSSLQWYREDVRLGKYTMQPLKAEMTEQMRVRDMQDKSLAAINVTYGRQQPDSFINFSPALLFCELGKDANSKMCQPVTAFTSSGVGYSFNTREFFEQYQHRSTLEIFCQEVMETKDQARCMKRKSSIEKEVTLIKTNGPRHALSLLLHTPSLDKHNWAGQKLALHSPYSIADMSGNVIDPQPGMLTTVVLTPHMTKTDESLLAKDRSQRGCHHQEADGNPLLLFANYTKDNCIFECKLQRSIDKCGCVPWDYPKLHEETRTCYQREASCFEDAMEQTDELETCSDCLDECWKVEYDYSIHTKPLKDICSRKEIRDAVNMIVNTKDGIDNLLPLYDHLREAGLDYHLVHACFNYVRKNTALVMFFIGPPSAVEITRRERLTFPEQVANLGGILSLLTGMSFVTLCEGFMYLLESLERLVKRLWRLIMQVHMVSQLARRLERCLPGPLSLSKLVGWLKRGVLVAMEVLSWPIRRLKRRFMTVYRARRRVAPMPD